VDAQQPACGADAAHLPGEREKTKPAAVDHVIIGQGGASLKGGGTPNEWRRRYFLERPPDVGSTRGEDTLSRYGIG
jgi:hypothetical protein